MTHDEAHNITPANAPIKKGICTYCPAWVSGTVRSPGRAGKCRSHLYATCADLYSDNRALRQTLDALRRDNAARVRLP